MASDPVERRLAAILAADVVGFSRLVGVDEEGTIARLNVLRREVIDPSIAGHNGRIVKTTGDGVLVEFASVVDAVRSAVEIQRSVAARNADLPEAHRITFRVGVNLGDIVVQDDDILGDGVNVAARLEGLAEPGGICIPRKVYDEVRNKLDVGYEFIGEQNVKNIETAIPVYRVLLGPEAAGQVTGEGRPQRRQRQTGLIAAVAFVLVTLIVAVFWWRPWEPASEPIVTPQTGKPSIAVLPFENMSDDPAQEYFADGMAEDIITDLSKLSALFVVPGDSSFRFKGRSVDIKRIGRELGVKYLLEGSVRRAGDQMRVNAQLIDAETGGQIWAERYDGKLADTFALQDKVTGRIIEALSIKLGADEKAKLADHGTNNFEAHDAFLKGQSFARQYTPEGYTLAIKEFERALDIDPNYARAAEAIKQARYIRENSGLQ